MLISKQTSPETYYRHSVNEMATMGTTQGCITIKVFSNEGPVPHLHFFIDANHQGCLQLTSARYFNHGKYTATLNANQRRDIIQFLSTTASSHGFSPGWSHYVDCCNEWNKNNPQYAMERQEMPDYSTL